MILWISGSFVLSVIGEGPTVSSCGDVNILLGGFHIAAILVSQNTSIGPYAVTGAAFTLPQSAKLPQVHTRDHNVNVPLNICSQGPGG